MQACNLSNFNCLVIALLSMIVLLSLFTPPPQVWNCGHGGHKSNISHTGVKTPVHNIALEILLLITNTKKFFNSS